MPRGKFDSANQKHYPDLGSEASSVLIFCVHFSDVIWQLAGKPVVVWPNVGCFLRLIDGQIKTVSLSQFKSKLKQQYLSVYLFWANTLYFVTSILLSSFFY